MFDSLCAMQYAEWPCRAGSALWGRAQVFCLHPIAHFNCHSLVTQKPIGQLVESSSSAKHMH